MKRRITIRAVDPLAPLEGRYIDGLAVDTFEITGEFDFQVEAVEEIVRVVLDDDGGQAREWTYTDPSGELAVGDRVVVPFGWSDTRLNASVVAIGRDKYTGPTKTVVGRLVETLVPFEEPTW